MSWSKEDKESPRGYHHGNLKEALLRAALELIAQKGPAGFTFAEAARWAGVSPAAPYRHFRDRDELLASVALRGFHQFEAGVGAGLGRGPAGCLLRARSARQGLSAISRAASPPTIRPCSRPAFRSPTNPELRDAGDRAFAVLRAAAEKLCAQVPAREPAAGADGRAAYLGDGAWHRFAVRARGRGAARRCRCRRRNCWRLRR